MEVPSEDRFSDLPNPVIHLIFSYLETNDIPRISGVSRKFRDACTSSPYLDLQADFLALKRCGSNCQGFQDFVHRVLGRRNGVGIHRLRLSWFCAQPYCKRAGALIDDWVRYATDCNVQELGIGVFPGDGELFVIPPCLSNCQSLRELTLNMKGSGLLLQLGFFASLVDLTLANVELCATFSGGGIGHWISTSCKSLKFLCLYKVTCYRSKDMSISSSSLQHLNLCACEFPEASKLSITSASLHHFSMRRCLFKERGKVVVRAERLENLIVDVVFSSDFPNYRCFQFSIFAPSLVTFSWRGPPASYSDNLEHFWHLDEASISLETLDFHHTRQDKEFARNFLAGLLHSVRYTRTLKLNTKVFAYYHHPGVFVDLKHLAVVVRRFEEDQDQTISPFLRGLRNLSTLTIKLDADNDVVADPNVIALLWMRRQRYVAKNRKPRKIAFCFHENEEDFGPGEDNEGMLKWILECEKALDKVKFYY
ncbi:uncharacterized protein LOC131330672 isoform X1 [Rhododendron vialii]|uniref:uncharacterized protein LOC131330672 isoform X1 n=1 Tax=Rhododendron vialii TaxID=182163 RepID=UPI00265DDA9D|nr:uncharacterized protein LOC131330672 isoform X1 [Rhododendron vialii]